MASKALVPTLVGVGGAALVTAGLTLGLAFPPLLAGALGVAIGTGGALVAASSRSPRDDGAAEQRKRVSGLLVASAASVSALEPRLRALRSRELWDQTPLDDNLLALCSAVRAVATLPATLTRQDADGDILMLHAIATEYLPPVVTLAEENDGMFARFSDASRDEVRKNVADLNEQAMILADAVRRIESDIVRGTSRDVAQHTEYLRARFTELGAPGFDLDGVFRELEAEIGRGETPPAA